MNPHNCIIDMRQYGKGKLSFYGACGMSKQEIKKTRSQIYFSKVEDRIALVMMFNLGLVLFWGAGKALSMIIF